MNKINRRLTLLAAPCIAGFLLFYLIPLAGSVRYAWVENAFTQDFVGLKNFIETVQNRNFRLSVKNTLELIAVGVPLLVGSALMLAMLVKNVGDRHPVLRAALLLPMLVPSAAITSVFGELAADAPRVALLMIYVWKNSGFLMLIFLAAISMVPNVTIRLCVISLPSWNILFSIPFGMPILQI